MYVLWSLGRFIGVVADDGRNRTLSIGGYRRDINSVVTIVGAVNKR